MNKTCQASEWQSALRLSISSWLHDDLECTILVNFFVFKGGNLHEIATATYKPELELTGRHTHHTGTTDSILVIKKKKGSSRTIKASRRTRKEATRSRRVTVSFRTGIQAGRHMSRLKKGRTHVRCLQRHPQRISAGHANQGIRMTTRTFTFAYINTCMQTLLPLRSFNIPKCMKIQSVFFAVLRAKPHSV